MSLYKVRDGDCILSIAQRHGFLWETLWDHPDNARLKELRQDPNVLLPGDVVVLPEKRFKEEEGSTGSRHRFQVRSNLARFKIRVLVDDQPSRGVVYELRLANGDVRTGSLDAEGFLVEDIPPDVEEGELIVGPPNDQMTWGLRFGGLDPITTPAGVEQRLVQLGFDSQKTLRDRVAAFQRKHGLDDTGEMNEATRARLQREYGQ
jgi:hypothetical protein